MGKLRRRGEHWQVDDTRLNRGEMIAYHSGLKDVKLVVALRLA